MRPDVDELNLPTRRTRIQTATPTPDRPRLAGLRRAGGGGSGRHHVAPTSEIVASGNGGGAAGVNPFNSSTSSSEKSWVHSFFFPPKREMSMSNDQMRVKYALQHMNISVVPPDAVPEAAVLSPGAGATSAAADAAVTSPRISGKRTIAAPKETFDGDDALAASRHGGLDQQHDNELSPTGKSEHSAQETMNDDFDRQDEEDVVFVQHFWRTYDDVIILSLFTQIGILFRLAIATYFTYFDSVFTDDSPLFVNLPLNSLSCFLMGLLSAGDRLMEIISTRFTPPHLQQDLFQEDLDESEIDNEMDIQVGPSDDYRMANAIMRRRQAQRAKPRRKKTEKSYFHSWQPPVQLNQDLRDVQLLALERRIRASKCLLLFPVRKEDIDVVEDYFREGYKRDDGDEDEEVNLVPSPRSFDLSLHESTVDSTQPTTDSPPVKASLPSLANTSKLQQDIPSSSEDKVDPLDAGDADRSKDNNPTNTSSIEKTASNDTSASADESSSPMEQATDLDQIINNVQVNVQENISRLKRVDLAHGWDVGTTPSEMSDDLLLGLRDGFCGALSSFSSWNSTMVDLMKRGEIGSAIVGYIIGLQLPIIAYRFGQHVSVYIFIWRCRREARRDERRGYGIRIDQTDSDHDGDVDDEEASGGEEEDTNQVEVPSVRAIATAIFIIALVTQVTSLSFYQDTDQQQLALSLLFSPLGVLARWRLSKLNRWKPTFPLGTFTANLLACALSGGLGRLLAGNPGPRTSIVLVSFVAGFGGTMSSVAAFITEILAGIDPVLLRVDGAVYAVVAIFAAIVVGFLFSNSVDWADETED